MAEFADALLKEIDHSIGQAMEAVHAGETEQLDGFMGRVEALCKGVIALEREEGQQYAPQLEYLRDRLDALQTAMEEAKQRVADEMEASHKRQLASRAYRPPEKK